MTASILSDGREVLKSASWAGVAIWRDAAICGGDKFFKLAN